MPGLVQTVLGAIDPEKLGRTLTHEHFFMDFTHFYVQPPAVLKPFLEGPLTMKNLGFVQRYPYSNKSNLEFHTEDVKKAVMDDVMVYKKLGGSTIVENTSLGLKRNVGFLKEVSQKTGVHVIAGTGFYLASVQPQSILNKNVEELAHSMRMELLVGCSERPDVKCGIIGEVGSTFPLHEFEIKAIRAAAEIQQELRCPVSFHPGRNPKAPSEVMRIYSEVGGCTKKAIMCHLDRTLKISELMTFADEYKCYLQQDLFGNEVLTYQLNPAYQMPSDTQRIERMKILIENGYLYRLLMTQDIHTKHRLLNYGGHGYCHLFANVLPKMRDMGITDKEIDQITIQNPKNWLTFG